jgi:hypothetical protein
LIQLSASIGSATPSAQTHAERGKRHEAAAGHWLRLAAFATGIATVGVAAGGMVGAVGGPWLLAIAALGAIGTAVVSFAASQEAIGQERERAQRFRNNVDALELLARQIEHERGAIGRGPECIDSSPGPPAARAEALERTTRWFVCLNLHHHGFLAPRTAGVVA